MNCPSCNADTKVIDSRGTRRRRQCLACGERFSTLEVMADDVHQVRARPAAKSKPVKPAKPVPTPKQRAAAKRRIEDMLDFDLVDDSDPMTELRGW